MAPFMNVGDGSPVPPTVKYGVIATKCCTVSVGVGVLDAPYEKFKP